jgi:PhnB protein
MPVNPIPEGFRTVTPSLTLKDAAKAIEFYKKAFGAAELMCMKTPDGRVGHCELKIGDSVIFINDEFPEMGKTRSPQTLGMSTGGICLYVEDVDTSYARAIEAGGTTEMPVADMFWGDRFGTLVDPFGHIWSIATRKEELTPEQMAERAKAFYAKAAA